MLQRPHAVHSLGHALALIRIGQNLWGMEPPKVSPGEVSVGAISTGQITGLWEYLCLLKANMEACKRGLASGDLESENITSVQNQLAWLDHHTKLVTDLFQALVFEHYPTVPIGRGDLRMSAEGQQVVVIIPDSNPGHPTLPLV